MPNKYAFLKKLEKLTLMAYQNAVRLHFDAMVLYGAESYAAAFQLSVLALEEMGKTKAVDHYTWSERVNGTKRDLVFERKFIEKLYQHPWKQYAMIGREYYNFTAKYAAFVETRGLEEKKQKAIYVGFGRKNGKINLTGRIYHPGMLKEKDARQQISLLNDIFREIIFLEKHQGMYWDSHEMNAILKGQVENKIFAWPHRSSIKIRKPFIVKGKKMSY
jgi:AbiV family abortive infection protein